MTQNARTDVSGYLVNDNEYFNQIQTKFVGQNGLFPALSCAQILESFPNSQSGYYWVGSARTYCSFDIQTPSDERAWERIANLDMSKSDASCPSPFRMVKPPETRGRYCIMTRTDAGCESYTIPFGSSNISRMYGRVYGIQIGSGDGINADREIDDIYLDGVSITIGSPREHVWSFISYALETESGCPCSTGSTRNVPGFVGDDYFCESGTLNGGDPPGTVYDSDLLWDGAQCGGLEGSCCVDTVPGTSAPSPPWFYKEFSAVWTGSVEVRICRDQDVYDEDVGVHLMELYVQ